MRSDVIICCFAIFGFLTVMLYATLLSCGFKHKHDWESVFYYTIKGNGGGRIVTLHMRSYCKNCSKIKDKKVETYQSLFYDSIQERVTEYRNHDVKSIEETL